jgi:hypothetical protein
MHWKTKLKLTTATKIYLTGGIDSSEVCTALRLQFENRTFIYIDLSREWPQRAHFQDLPFGVDISFIRHFGTRKATEILTNSKDYDYNNPETVEQAIEIVSKINNKYM